MGKQYAVGPDEGVTVKYVYDEQTKATAQTVSVGGQVVSSLNLGEISRAMVPFTAHLHCSIWQGKGMGNGRGMPARLQRPCERPP
jgi:hypothetical protein